MDIVTLGVQVDSSQLIPATKQLDRFGDQAQTTERQVQKMGAASAKSFSAAARGARSMSRALGGSGMRNAALQLSQVAQQASATGDPIRALAIQLPDLTLGFGPLGIAAGVVAGALLPVAAGFLGVGDAGDAMGDRLEELESVVAGLDQSLDILTASTADLRDRYGEAAETVRLFAVRQAELRLAQLNSQLQQQTSVLRDMAQSYYTSIDAGRNYRNTLLRIQNEFGLAGQAAREFESALQQAATATTLDQQAAALDRVFGLLEDSGISASEIPPELANALDEMISLIRETRAAEKAANDVASAVDGITGATSGAANEAARLAFNLANALNLSNNVAAGRIKEGVRSGALPPQALADAPQTSAEEALSRRNLDSILSVRRARARSSPRGGRGGRRSSSANREALEIERERSRILEGLKTEQQKYNEKIAQADRLLQAGALTQSQYNAHVKQLGAEFQEVQFESLYRGIESISDAIGGAIARGEDLGDAMRSVLQQILADILSSGIKNALTNALTPGATGGGSGGGFFGNLLRGLFSFDGGGYTGSGSRVGGVDGKGGFPAILHPNETVIDHTRTGGAGQSFTVINNFDGNTIRTTIRDEAGRMIGESAPGIAARGAVMARQGLPLGSSDMNRRGV